MDQAARIREGRRVRPAERWVPEREAADDERDQDEPEQPRLLPPRSRPDRAEGELGGAGAGRAVAGPAVMVVVPSGSRPLEPHPDLADLDLVTEPERRDAVDTVGRSHRCRWCSRGPRRTRARPRIGADRVLRRGERVLDDDRVIDVATHGGGQASSPNDEPLGGSPAGEATITSRPASVAPSRVAARRRRARDRRAGLPAARTPAAGRRRVRGSLGPTAGALTHREERERGRLLEARTGVTGVDRLLPLAEAEPDRARLR